VLAGSVLEIAELGWKGRQSELSANKKQFSTGPGGGGGNWERLGAAKKRAGPVGKHSTGGGGTPLSVCDRLGGGKEKK